MEVEEDGEGGLGLKILVDGGDLVVKEVHQGVAEFLGRCDDVLSG